MDDAKPFVATLPKVKVVAEAAAASNSFERAFQPAFFIVPARISNVIRKSATSTKINEKTFFFKSIPNAMDFFSNGIRRGNRLFFLQCKKLYPLF